MAGLWPGGPWPWEPWPGADHGEGVAGGRGCGSRGRGAGSIRSSSPWQEGLLTRTERERVRGPGSCVTRLDFRREGVQPLLYQAGASPAAPKGLSPSRSQAFLQGPDSGETEAAGLSARSCFRSTASSPRPRAVPRGRCWTGLPGRRRRRRRAPGRAKRPRRRVLLALTAAPEASPPDSPRPPAHSAVKSPATGWARGPGRQVSARPRGRCGLKPGPRGLSLTPAPPGLGEGPARGRPGELCRPSLGQRLCPRVRSGTGGWLGFASSRLPRGARGTAVTGEGERGPRPSAQHLSTRLPGRGSGGEGGGAVEGALAGGAEGPWRACLCWRRLPGARARWELSRAVSEGRAPGSPACEWPQVDGRVHAGSPPPQRQGESRDGARAQSLVVCLNSGPAAC